MTALDRLVASIVVPDGRLADAARQRLDSLTKPRGSLGRLEELAVRVVVITGNLVPRVEAPVIFTLAGDHGVAAEGVSAYPQAVTAQMVENLARGGAAVNVLARHVGARVVVADLGVAGPLAGHGGVVERRIAPGTRSITKGPAMSPRGNGSGDRRRGGARRGVGARTASAPGRWGSGTRPRRAPSRPRSPAPIPRWSRAAARAWPTTSGWGRSRRSGGLWTSTARIRGDPLGVLAAVGGFEIAGLVGVVLAGAARRVPVVLDGFIATAAGLVAARLAPAARSYLLAAHRSAEPGHVRLLEALGLTPYLELGMRLGEGTGAALGIGLLRAALACYREMATFKEAGVSERSR